MAASAEIAVALVVDSVMILAALSSALAVIADRRCARLSVPEKFLDRPGEAGNWHYYVQIYFSSGMSTQTVTARYGKVTEMKNNTSSLGGGTGSGGGVGSGGGSSGGGGGGGGGYDPDPGGGGGGDQPIITA